MVTINVVGILSFGIGVVTMFQALDELTDIGPHLLLAFLNVIYSMVATLLLIPIYMRLKVKLIEE